MRQCGIHSIDGSGNDDRIWWWSGKWTMHAVELIGIMERVHSMGCLANRPFSAAIVEVLLVLHGDTYGMRG